MKGAKAEKPVLSIHELYETYDANDVDKVRELIQMRRRAKDLEDEAKEMKDNSNTELTKVLDKMGLYDVRVAEPGVGSLTYRMHKSSTLNASKLKSNMLAAGIDADKTMRIITSSTTVTERYVPFFDRPKKEE